MVDLKEINEEIERLESGRTTYQNCERLAVLYCVRDGMGREEQPQEAYSFSNRSEFIEAMTRADLPKALEVLDEHFELIKALYPKEYQAIIRKIAALAL